MINLILSSTGEWGKVALVVGGLFISVILLATIYSYVTEKTEIKDKDGCGWPLFLIVAAIVIGLLMNMKNCSCKSTHENDYNPSDEYWENTPRHTQIQKPMQKTVNTFIFQHKTLVV